MFVSWTFSFEVLLSSCSLFLVWFCGPFSIQALEDLALLAIVNFLMDILSKYTCPVVLLCVCTYVNNWYITSCNAWLQGMAKTGWGKTRAAVWSVISARYNWVFHCQVCCWLKRCLNWENSATWSDHKQLGHEVLSQVRPHQIGMWRLYVVYFIVTCNILLACQLFSGLVHD